MGPVEPGPYLRAGNATPTPGPATRQRFERRPLSWQRGASRRSGGLCEDAREPSRRMRWGGDKPTKGPASEDLSALKKRREH